MRHQRSQDALPPTTAKAGMSRVPQRVNAGMGDAGGPPVARDGSALTRMAWRMTNAMPAAKAIIGMGGASTEFQAPGAGRCLPRLSLGARPQCPVWFRCFRLNSSGRPRG